MSPSVPAIRSPSRAPAACAASSTTGSPSSERSSPHGAGTPNRSTATIAFVDGVRAARTVGTVTLRVSGSTSQKRGRAPIAATASAVA